MMLHPATFSNGDHSNVELLGREVSNASMRYIY